MNRLTARRVRRLRRRIDADRCPCRPGVLHDWAWDAEFDPTSFGAVIEWWACTKCGEVDR